MSQFTRKHWYDIATHSAAPQRNGIVRYKSRRSQALQRHKEQLVRCCNTISQRTASRCTESRSMAAALKDGVGPALQSTDPQRAASRVQQLDWDHARCCLLRYSHMRHCIATHGLSTLSTATRGTTTRKALQLSPPQASHNRDHTRCCLLRCVHKRHTGARRCSVTIGTILQRTALRRAASQGTGAEPGWGRRWHGDE